MARSRQDSRTRSAGTGAGGAGAAAGSGAAGATAGTRGTGGAGGTGAPPAADPPGLETRNEVTLVGRVAAPAEERTLPSGDVIATWRLVVDRPPGGRVVPQGVRPSTVDTLDCVAWTAGTRRSARSFAAGDVVCVVGALRRRFWRAGAGAVSRCEVEVAAVRRLSRAPRRASPG